MTDEFEKCRCCGKKTNDYFTYSNGGSCPICEKCFTIVWEKVCKTFAQFKKKKVLKQ